MIAISCPPSTGQDRPACWKVGTYKVRDLSSSYSFFPQQLQPHSFGCCRFRLCHSLCFLYPITFLCHHNARIHRCSGFCRRCVCTRSAEAARWLLFPDQRFWRKVWLGWSAQRWPKPYRRWLPAGYLLHQRRRYHRLRRPRLYPDPSHHTVPVRHRCYTDHWLLCLWWRSGAVQRQQQVLRLRCCQRRVQHLHKTCGQPGRLCRGHSVFRKWQVLWQRW